MALAGNPKRTHSEPKHSTDTMKLMKTNLRFLHRTLATMLCAATIAGGFAPRADAAALPRLDVQNCAVNRDKPQPASFAPVVRKVSPSVVNIYTAKTVRENPAISPLFDDPFFRQFFGVPFENVPREVGDTVLAIGNPFGVGQTVTTGIVSAKSRGGMGIVDYEDFIQTDASINPGNSGGALVDIEGRLVGINQSIISRSGGNQGIGFA